MTASSAAGISVEVTRPVDHVGDRGRLDRRHGAQLDAGGDVARCGCGQQVAHGGGGGLDLAEFFFQAAQMGGDPLVAGAQVWC